MRRAVFFPELQPPDEAIQLGRYVLRIGDAVDFVRRSAKGSLAGTFDLIVMDTTDALLSASVGAPGGKEFFSPELYSNFAKMLKPGSGVLAQNVQSLDHERDVRLMRDLHLSAFDHVAPFWISTPDYISPYFAFVASNGGPHCPQHPLCARQMVREGLAGRSLRFYTAEVHAASFVLPASMTDVQASADGCPVAAKLGE